jgi:hypothetical protein
MAKTLQTTTRRKASTSAKKPVKRAAKAGAKPTLGQLNRLLTQNREQVVRKAKENTLRLIGRETL